MKIRLSNLPCVIIVFVYVLCFYVVMFVYFLFAAKYTYLVRRKVFSSKCVSSF